MSKWQIRHVVQRAVLFRALDAVQLSHSSVTLDNLRAVSAFWDFSGHFGYSRCICMKLLLDICETVEYLGHMGLIGLRFHKLIYQPTTPTSQPSSGQRNR